jgi:hypothetical protein
MILYAVTIFVSAFLLFLVQPIIAKQILPWFGGSSAVWTTCMVFFQCVLFAGYAYADWIARRFSIRRQVIVHAVLLLISLISLPIIASVGWKPSGSDDPSWRILGLLMATIGLPYFLLSTTGPLVQAWFVRGYARATVYRLYSLSNLASLMALLAYPFLIEPWVMTRTQAWVWSGVYFLFIFVCTASGIYTLRKRTTIQTEAVPQIDNPASSPMPGKRAHLTWLLFSAMGAFMLLSVTNYITYDLASVPFLWILPLSLYLLTFILCFEGRNWYKRKWFIVPVTLSVLGIGWSLIERKITVGIPVSLIGLFVICMFFHGELVARKPAPEYLTRFYLMLSLGGALGGLAVGVGAVKLFNANYELIIGLVMTVVLLLIVLRSNRKQILLFFFTAWAVTIVYALTSPSDFMYGDVLSKKRNFYGSLKVKEVGFTDGKKIKRTLVHGVIIHGEQYHAEDRQGEPTLYYRADSGVGRALETITHPNRRVGVIGLGVGTLAAYGRPGDVMRFYDINPQVIEVAQSYFTYLKRSKASIEIVLGDARLSMEGEVPQAYDLIVVDAFSSDSIPAHLVTIQAMDVYLRHLKPNGIIAFHISNKFLNLAPVLKKIADEKKLYGMLVVDPSEGKARDSSDWFLMTEDATLQFRPAISPQIRPVKEIDGLRVWTDDFNNLFQILEWREN